MPTERIYGRDCWVPDVPAAEEIAAGRKFQLTEIPDIFDEMEYDEEGRPVLDEEQAKWVAREIARIDNGYWFFNKGKKQVPTYITGLHYFYLNYWTLESGDKPDYRDCDRRWFLYYDEVRNRTSKKGVIRIKKRREGATSQASCSLYYRAVRYKNSNCGIVSKTDTDAKDVFLKMIMKGHLGMYEFLKPRVEDDDAKTILRFREKKRRKEKKEKGQLKASGVGNESIIEYRSTSLNAYDSGRLSELLLDEAGKFPTQVPINAYWPIVKKTLIKGARKVGFCQMPSTVNEEAKGGKGFKILWDDSEGMELARYFCPAYDGFEGYIDEYGDSIIENPTEEQQEWMRSTGTEFWQIGAKQYLMMQRELITDLSALSEEVRMNPFDEREAFMISDFKCYVNATKVQEQIQYLMDRQPQVLLRKIRFYWKDPNDWSKGVDWADDPTGMWEMLMDCAEEFRNSHELTENGKMKPGNKSRYACGVDPFKSSQTISLGSRGAAWIGRRWDAMDPENSCMPVARFVGRTKLKSEFYMQVLMGCVYYGCEANFERDAGDDYYEFYQMWGMLKYLMKAPDSIIKKDISQTMKEKKKSIYGTQSGDSFALGVMLEQLKSWVENHIGKMFWLDQCEELLVYDHEDRTKFDSTCAFMALLPALVGSTKAESKKPALKKSPFIKTYSLT